MSDSVPKEVEVRRGRISTPKSQTLEFRRILKSATLPAAAVLGLFIGITGYRPAFPSSEPTPTSTQMRVVLGEPVKYPTQEEATQEERRTEQESFKSSVEKESKKMVEDEKVSSRHFIGKIA